MTVFSRITCCSLAAVIALPVAALLCGAAPAMASPILGSAELLAVSGGVTVTNTGATTLKGDLDVNSSASIMGLGSISITGAVHRMDAAAQQAQADAAAAAVSLAALPFTQDLTGQDLGGLTLTPGVYRFASSAQLTGTLTLDFGNRADQIFVFQIGSALTTASSSMVDVRNGSTGSGVFFNVGSSATLGTQTLFAGNILADQSITLSNGASILCGRAMALNGTVALDTNIVSNDCTEGGSFQTGRTDFGSNGFGNDGTTAPGSTQVPEPASLASLGMGLIAMAMQRTRRRAGLLGRARP